MYIPRRLQQNFNISEEKHGENIIVKGLLTCCGLHDFRIEYFGEIKTTLLGNSFIYSENNTVALVAECRHCNKRIQVFNSFTDGYNNCISGTHSQQLFELNFFSCTKCSKDIFSLDLCIEYQTKEELEEIGIQEYENAFSWIWISPTCSSCKRKFKNFVDIETA